MNKLTLTLVAGFFVACISGYAGYNAVKITFPSEPQPSEPTPEATTNPTSTSDPLSSPNSDAFVISDNGIGAAKLGMSFGQLKQTLGDEYQFEVKSPFLVDWDAIAVTRKGEEQYYILYPAGTTLQEDDPIEILVTDNPKYRTAGGVGPGTSLAQAESVYGNATLSYHLANESREYVNFADQPSKDIAFRLGAANDDSLGGIYPSAVGEYHQTQEFENAASIRLVEVHCRGKCQ